MFKFCKNVAVRSTGMDSSALTIGPNIQTTSDIIIIYNLIIIIPLVFFVA